VPSSNRTFRVFVSSTFSDLGAERSALQEKVFPKLKQLCLEHGCRFQAIDLRWGVRKEAGYDQQTMKICIEEIRRCQKTKLKPNFIVLLGNKYGWQPAPSEIVSDEFEQIRALASKEEQNLLNFWYKEDRNAKPSVDNDELFLYCLQPREEKYKDEQVWQPIERQLRSIMTKGAISLNLSQNELVKYIASATEQEINQGLSDLDSKQHVFCFFRNLTGLKEKPNKDFIDIEDDKIDQESQTKLENLKSRLTMFLSGNVKNYEDFWDGSKIARSHIDSLCSDVERYLSELINQEVASKGFDNVDSLSLEVGAHEEFGKERSKFFVGRTDTLDAINGYLQSAIILSVLWL
jgi:hypothetical protein